MKRTLVLARRELAAFLNAPASGLVLAAAPVFSAAWFLFVDRFFARDQASLRGFFAVFSLALTVLAPALTMRSWAEERRQGTAELLLSMPFTTAELVAGKFLAAWTLLVASIAVSLPVPLALFSFGHFDPGIVVAEYAGLVLFAMAAAAIGQFSSARSENQTAAFLSSLLALLALTLLNRINGLLELPLPVAGLVSWVSLGSHLEPFSRGVIETADLAWYILVAALFLWLGARSVDGRKLDAKEAPAGRRKEGRIVAALGCSVFAAAALLSSRSPLRADLSEDKSQTLSTYMKVLVSGLDDPIRIAYWRSRTLADRHPGPRAVEDLLRTIESASRGRVSVRIIDSSKDPAAAEELGIEPRQMETVEEDEQRLAIVHSGIVLEYLDASRVLPAALTTENLEYELARSILALVNGRDPVAAMLSGDTGRTLDADYRFLVETLGRSAYVPREQERGRPIDSDASVLFVLGVDALDGKDAALIDAFLRSGRGVFVAARGVSVDPEDDLAATALGENAVLDLLAGYGVNVLRELALDERSLSVPYQTVSDSGAAELRYVAYPHWIAVDSRYVSGTHPITRRFGGLDLFWPSPIELTPRDGFEATVLATTGPRGWRQRATLYTGIEEKDYWDREASATRGRQVLAVALEGRPPGAGPVPGSGSPASSRLVVVSGSDSFTDLATYTESGFNAEFAALAADWLSGEEDLLSIKARAVRDGRLDRVGEAALESKLKTFAYLAIFLFAPGAAVIAPLLRNARRRAREGDSRRGKRP
ncbi:MAG: Gldg family protein [Spirochaetales bacterium]|nr:Gldg family protein [Spirochaetales bacterium]